MKTTLIIQARMGSSRLPGKVLMEISGKPMLEWVIRRGSQAKKIDEVLVATTDDPGDDPIEQWCNVNNISCFRGSVYDVLDRFFRAALYAGTDIIVRVTADCPLIDPKVLDDVIDLFLTSGADFAANRLPPPWHRTFPVGLDVEVVRFRMLEKAWKEARKPFEREHVMPWFYSVEGRCKVEILDHDPDYGMHRWTVDTPEDYILLQEIFKKLDDPLRASWYDVLKIVEQNPDLERINRSTQAKRVDVVDERSIKKE
ncbi:MAG: NTP transferase domain-containing protein [Flexilinea sp.]